MKTIEYMTLSRVSGEISDKFYKCISKWIRHDPDKPDRSSCVDLGRQYADALTKQLQYLEALAPDPQRDEAIRMCETYRTTLEKSLGLLENAIKKDH